MQASAYPNYNITVKQASKCAFLCDYVNIWRVLTYSQDINVSIAFSVPWRYVHPQHEVH